MTRLCLDTSAFSFWQRGHPECNSILDQSRDVGMPAISLGELRAGFRLGNREEKNEQELREFLAIPYVRVLAVDEEVAEHYAQIVADLTRAGTPLPTNDIWIAALALREGATLLTFDEHFRLIPRVGVHFLRP